MTVLVTGGCGYIGSHLVWMLYERREEVVVIDDLSSGHEWAIPKNITLYKGDVGDACLVSSILKERNVDAVFHFAGSTIVPESTSDPIKYYNNNTFKSLSLIKSCVMHGVKYFIFSSTAAVYGNTKEGRTTEEMVPSPVSPYGSSKLMTEVILKDTSIAHGLNFTALRYFNVAGADPKGRTGQSTKGATHLIKVACEVSLGLRSEIEVFGTDYDTVDGTGVRDYIHVTDLVGAHCDALDRLRAGGGSLIANCGYGTGFSVLDVLRAVERVGGKPVPIKFSPRRPGDAAAVVASVELIRAELPWIPRWNDLDQIVGHALEWEAILRRRGLSRER